MKTTDSVNQLQQSDLKKSPGQEDPARQLPKFENNREMLRFLFYLILENKKWWLLPLLFVLMILSVFIGLSGNQSILPAIYALF
jgi:hypothetical protein